MSLNERLNGKKRIKAKSDFLKLRVRVSGLIVAAGILACTATVAGFAGKFHWLLDLCSHFPVQCAVFLLLSGVAVGLLRKRAVCAVFIAFACLNLFRILPQTIPRNDSGGSARAHLTMLLINVRTENREFSRVRDLVQAKKPDIVVFEEVNRQWMQELEPLKAEFSHVVAEPREDNFGIALFSKSPLRTGKVIYFGSAEVPSIVTEVQTAAGEILVVATHPLPPVGRERFGLRNEQLQSVARYVKTNRAPIIVLGDLNSSPWSYYFKRFIRESGLTDTSLGKGWQPTWPTMLPLLLVPIDHALYSEGLLVLARETGPHIGSDHYPLGIRFGLPGRDEPGP